MGKFCIVGGRPVNKGVGMLQMSRAKRSAQRRPSKPWRCCWRCCRTLSQKFGSVSWLWLLRFNESTLAGSRRSTMARKGPETAFWEITPGEGRNLATVSFSLKDIFVESELTADTACVKSAKSIGVRSGQLAHPPAGVGAPERAGHRDDQGRRDRATIAVLPPRLRAAPVRGGAHRWALFGRIHAEGDGRRTVGEYVGRLILDSVSSPITSAIRALAVAARTTGGGAGTGRRHRAHEDREADRRHALLCTGSTGACGPRRCQPT
jgi:hypothetical protein